jgi:small subunit ribosomal protein S8
MSQTHLLSDTVARIKNAQAVQQTHTISYYSNNIRKVLDVLTESGYIDNIEILTMRKGIKMIKIYLRYYGKFQTPAISEVDIISKPGRRVFKSYKQINRLYGGLGITVISTSKGIISDNEARDIKAGGEILCNVF